MENKEGVSPKSTIMLNSKLHLHPKILTSDVEQAPTRDGFGKGLLEAAALNPNVVALCADLAESTRTHWFKEKFPNRYIEMGVAEQNLATVASGLAAYGKIPFITSYAAFSPGRNNEQIRTTISLNNVPVKIGGMHAGVSVGPDGATHQQLEDIALMRVQPNMTVIYPADAEEARKATIAAAESPGPVYLRFAREKTPIMTTNETPFAIGKAHILYESKGKKGSVALIATGPLLYNALLAAEMLTKDGVGVTLVNLATIKPLDKEIILKAAQAGAVVTVEEHQIAGGMGSAVAEYLAQNYPVPMEFIGVHDQFGQSGEPNELIEHYGMGVLHITAAARKVMSRIS